MHDYLGREPEAVNNESPWAVSLSQSLWSISNRCDFSVVLYGVKGTKRYSSVSRASDSRSIRFIVSRYDCLGLNKPQRKTMISRLIAWIFYSTL